MKEGGNPNARHHGKGLERATFCHGVELSYCLVTVRALTETMCNQIVTSEIEEYFTRVLSKS